MRATGTTWMGVAAVAAVMTAGCLGPRGELCEEPSVRLKGGGPTPLDALKQLDAMLEERATELEHAGQSFHRSLVVEYRKVLLEQGIPELRRRIAQARAVAAEAEALRGEARLEKLHEAGVRYECLLVASQVLAGEVSLMAMGEVADEKGQPSMQIFATVRAFDADMAGVSAAAARLDAPELATELIETAPKYQKWMAFLDRWGKALVVGETWSRWGYLVADSLMMAVSAAEMAELMANRMVPPGPPAVVLSPGGATLASHIDPKVLANAVEAIRRLIASGALDSAVMGGLDMLVRPMAAKGGDGPVQLEFPYGPRWLPPEGPRDTLEPAETVQKVNGQNPRNFKYAGTVFTAKDLPTPELRAKYPRGVPFTPEGFPDFRGYMLMEVELDGITGEEGADQSRATEAAGLKRAPKGYMWHHHEGARKMQLVPKDLHDAVRHTGGAAKVRELQGGEAR